METRPPTLDYRTPIRPPHCLPQWTIWMVLRGLGLTLFLATIFGIPAGLLTVLGIALTIGGFDAAFTGSLAVAAGMVLFGLILTTIGAAMLIGIAVYVWSQWRDHEW